METGRRIKTLLSFLFSFMLSIPVFAQDVEMADVMRSNGKIYVVITVLGIVLAVLLIYLFSIDSKVKKLEEKMKNRK